MVWTVKLLVIANRTVDSAELFRVLEERAERGPIDVTLVAPASSDSESIRGAGVTSERLDRAVQRLREAGVATEGMVVTADPLVAVDEVWDPRNFDEVIVVTLPTGTSRWLSIDLPRRVARLTGANVTHVVATPSRRPVPSTGQ